MSSNCKVHSQGNVPFSWENRPGISKECPTDLGTLTLKSLPPPPNGSKSTDHGTRIVGHDLQNIPLPPCPFQPPPTRSSSRKGLKRHDDPFLAAYRECTKTVKQGKLLPAAEKKKSNNGGLFSFSCKHSCGVRDDSLVRMPQLSSSARRETSVWLQNGRTPVDRVQD